MKKVAFYVWGLCASLILCNCKGQNAGGNSGDKAVGDSVQVENPLNVGMPQVEKFVIVTNEENAEVFKYADEESPWRNRWWEECECDNPDVAVKWSNENVPDNYTCEKYGSVRHLPYWAKRAISTGWASCRRIVSMNTVL